MLACKSCDQQRQGCHYGPNYGHNRKVIINQSLTNKTLLNSPLTLSDGLIGFPVEFTPEWILLSSFPRPAVTNVIT